MKKIIPLLVLALAAGLGLAAGKFLQPVPVETSDTATEEDSKAATPGPNELYGQPIRDPNQAVDYVKLNNQFVVPVVANERVASLVVLSLSIEVPEGKQEEVLRKEPKLRDSFLQVLFIHANIGGFAGEFTGPNKLNGLRRSLLEIAQRDLGKDVVYDVLILEIARQDY
jgi:flagellar basal body-associated protein FliL